MNNQIQIFSNSEFGAIRTITGANNEPLFIATDVAKALGYTNPQKAIRDHCRGVTKRSVGVQTGLKQDGTPSMQNVEVSIIPESDVFRLIMRSKLPQAEVFQDWVCEDILPSVRKDGGYMVPIPEETDAEAMARGLLIAQRTIESANKRADYETARAESLERQAYKMQGQIDHINKRQGKLIPDAAYTKKVLQSESSYTLTQVAHSLNLRSVHVLTKWLKEKKIIYYQSGQWQPTIRVAAKGYFSTRTHKRETDGKVVTSIYIVVTELGRKYLYDLLKREEGAL